MTIAPAGVVVRLALPGVIAACQTGEEFPPVRTNGLQIELSELKGAHRCGGTYRLGRRHSPYQTYFPAHPALRLQGGHACGTTSGPVFERARHGCELAVGRSAHCTSRRVAARRRLHRAQYRQHLQYGPPHGTPGSASRLPCRTATPVAAALASSTAGCIGTGLTLSSGSPQHTAYVVVRMTSGTSTDSAPWASSPGVNNLLPSKHHPHSVLHGPEFFHVARTQSFRVDHVRFLEQRMFHGVRVRLLAACFARAGVC